MSDGTWTIGELGNSIDNIEAREYDPYPARTIAVPQGYAAYIYPVAITDSATDDGAQILDHIAGPLRGAAAHVQEYLDNGEDG